MDRLISVEQDLDTFSSPNGDAMRQVLLDDLVNRWVTNLPIGSTEKLLGMMVLQPNLKNYQLRNWNSNTAWSILRRQHKV